MLRWKGTAYPAHERYQSAASNIQAVVRRKKQQANVSNLKLSKPVATLVEKRIDKANPSGHAAYHLRRYQFTNLISDAPTSRLWSVIPEIATGTLRSDRLGATARCKSLVIKGKIDIPADDNVVLGNDDRAEIYVRLMVLSVKRDQLLSEIVTEWNTFYDPVFFKNNASPTAPTGKYVDMVSKINRELFTVHSDKVIKLQRNLGYFPDPTSTSGAATQRPASRDFSISMKMKNKILKYNTPSTTLPSNFQPFCCALFSFGNGANPSTSAVPFVEYMSHMTYKP